MRIVTIKRKKHFAGFILTYLCVIDDKIAGGMGNGRSLDARVSEDPHTMYIELHTSTGTVKSNIVKIEGGIDNKKFLVVTKYKFIKGTKLLLEEVKES